MGTILSGKEVAKFHRKKIKEETAELTEKTGKKPGIACILVGEDPASQVYVASKEKTANRMGFKSVILRLPDTVTEADLLSKVEEFNNDESIHGILVQLPLPKHINEEKIILSISPEKDVDVFHPQTVGALWSGTSDLAPCTPFGCIQILKYYKIPIKGKRVVIVGRSNIVGKPLAALFLREHATVTVCHSRTQDLPRVCQEADILVGAIGKANFITKDYVKPDSVLIDVGINRLEDGSLAGDIDFDNVKDIASAITPVPGGVGPMTIAMLMFNTLTLFKEYLKNG